MPNTRRSSGSVGFAALCAALLGVFAAGAASAINVDQKGEIKLGVRTYTAVRLGTEHTDVSIVGDGYRQIHRSMTFPISSSYSVRQHRVFAEVEWRHDISRLAKEGFGPLYLLKYLPFKVRKLRYFLSYRGEYEGIYDYGPSEFRNHTQFNNETIVTPPPPPFRDIAPSLQEITDRERKRLRDIGSNRHRLFQAYVQGKVGKVTMRLGRQILAWGETDVFRLLDNINPLDASFGGFLVSLDERRVPLDMLRATWYLGDFSRTGVPGLSVLSHLPFYEAYLEGFVSIDDKVGYSPGVPKGSAWGPPNINVPTRSIFTDFFTPDRNINDARWGFNFRFSTPFPGIGDAALGFAHYYTYFDIPSVRLLTQNFPAPITEPGLGQDFSVWAQQTAPQVTVSGFFGNFAIPPEWVRPIGISGEPIIRFELAYFRDEPRNSQRTMDPFMQTFLLGGCRNDDPGNPNYSVNENGNYDPEGPYCTAGARTGDSWNMVLGLDLQQWVRWINPNSSLFITTQFFYKRLNGAQRRRPIDVPLDRYLPGQDTIYEGEILPVQKQVISSDLYVPTIPGTAPNADATVPNFVHSPRDQFLQTLLITTPYHAGRILPSLTLLYDWHGAWVFQPSLTLSYDPFRFTVTYNFLEATDLQGGNGISLLRDRDNLLFQFEYVI